MYIVLKIEGVTYICISILDFVRSMILIQMDQIPLKKLPRYM